LTCSSQVNESGPSHVRGNEFGSCGDSSEQKGKVTGRCYSKAELFAQDVPTKAHDVISSFPRGYYLDANLVTVTMSVVIARSSAMVQEGLGE
jgi:hypothetical protein